MPSRWRIDCLVLCLSLVVHVRTFSACRQRQPQACRTRQRSRSSLFSSSSSTAASTVHPPKRHKTKRPTTHGRSSNTNTTAKDERAIQTSTSPYSTNLILSQLAADAAHNASCAAQAEALLRSIPHPDTISYNGVLKAYAKAGNPERAQTILGEMKGSSTTTGDNGQDTAVSPDVWSYSTVMDAWSREKSSESAARAHALLYELQELYQATRDPRCRPNTVAYNTVLSAYAKSGGGQRAAELAQALLQDMLKDELADEISYNTVLLAWARSGIRHAGERAEELLRQMPVHHLKPNARSYSTVLDAWSKCARDVIGAATRALDLLEEMQQKGKTDPSIRPNSISYSTVIHAFSLSREPDKADRAWQLLQRMLHEQKSNPDVAPSIITYNNVLNACATATPNTTPTRSLPPETMVRHLYQELLRHPTLRPDHFTYGTVLKACANIKCADTPEFVQQVFEQCCSDGQVSFGVCYQLRQAATSEVYRRLIPPQAYIEEKGHFSMKDMPREWTRNVRDKRSGGKMCR